MDIALISSFYSVEPFMPAASAYQAKKIILIVDADKGDAKLKENIGLIKKTFGSVSEISESHVDSSDIFMTAKVVVHLIDSENAAGKRVIVAVSGGFKLMAHALLLACFTRPDKVERIVCANPKDNSLVELPKLGFGVSGTKKKLLLELSKREGKSIDSIAKRLGKSRAMVYQHLKELKENGYVDEKFDITLAGRLALL